MKKHPYRAALIWGMLVIALVNVYPTVGWMLTPEDDAWIAKRQEAMKIADPAEREQALEAVGPPAPGTRQGKLAAWKAEDDERAREEQGAFQSMLHTIKRWAEFDRDRVINLGLDLQGGVHMVMGFNASDLPEDKRQEYRDQGYTDDDIESRVQEKVLQQVRNRIDRFEADEPIIQALGRNQIQVQLPGEKDVNRARALITKTAQLNFHIASGPDGWRSADILNKIEKRYPGQLKPYLRYDVAEGGALKVPAEHYERVKEVIGKAQAVGGIVPEGKMIAFSRHPKPREPQEYTLFLMDAEPIQTGEGLRSARAIPDPSSPGNWQILFGFNADAGAHFGEVTQKNINQPMAIVLDDVVLGAPVIRDRITVNGQITGNFSGEEANDLAIALDSGSMEVPVREEYIGVVGPSLGKAAVRGGVISSLLGLALTAAFIMIYYQAAGLIAFIALTMNAVLIVAAMAYFQMTLTLPGIAGLILTIGMAIDGNVLIYERIREELRLGHTLLNSIENGFSRAAITILDANVTTLIAAAVLLQFGTGPVEGFAITLSIGVITTLFSVLVVSHGLFDFAAGRQMIKKLRMMNIIREDVAFPFMSYRKAALVGSVLLIFAGMGMFGFRWSQDDIYGVDFTEGTDIKLSLDAGRDVRDEEVRQALTSAGFAAPIVQEIGAGDVSEVNRFSIRVSETAESPAEASTDGAAPAEGVTVAQRIQTALAPLVTGGNIDKVQMDQVLTVGPAIGRQLRIDAIMAVIYSLFFITVYVAFRFEWKFSIGALVATVHDVIVTVGVLALLDRHIDMTVVAALLTIIGYSLNDTIVVFDRIREDLKVYRGKGYTLIAIMDKAINSTLSRTILTGGTTLLVIVVLLIFGGDAIFDFALTLFIGIVVGTFSSVFVASPVVYLIQKKLDERRLAAESEKGGGTRRRKPKDDAKAQGAPA